MGSTLGHSRMEESRSVVLALSGGMDSTTVMGMLLAGGYVVHPVIFTYGSKHNRYENEAAHKVIGHFRQTYDEQVGRQIGFDLTPIMGNFTSNLLKSGGAIPEGHYTDASMSQTVVPGRNIIFLSILAGVAWSVGADSIAIGIHQGDHAIYEDCRREFYKAMDTAIYLGTGGRVQIIAPVLNLDKTGILEVGFRLGVPYHLTRTCYKDQPLSCGKCGSCVERLEAFANHGQKDCIAYEDEVQDEQ